MADPTPSDDGTRAMPSGSGPPPAPGDSLGEAPPARIGRYEVRSLLGEGAFGRVFLAFDAELERPVAIKVPKPEGFTPDMRERFVREARATAKIHHPNVCPVLDVGTEGTVPYIVMHYQPGTTLGAHLDKWKALAPQQAVALAQKLALGMAAAHEKGVIHRDLKPQNVLFDPTRQLVLITDFGLARIGTQSQATAAGAVFGTPLYMSPEQARGETDAVGPLSDVYSLGVILYRMLVGALPFDGTVYEVLIKHNEAQPVAPSLARRGLDSKLDALVLKALAKKPGDRYPSAKVFADALAEYARTGGDSGWARAVADVKSSPAVPAVPAVPPLAPRPVAVVPPIAPPPLKPAAKSDRPQPAAAPAPPPTVPLPPPEPSKRPVPPRKVVEAEDDGGAIRQKVLIGGVALLFLLVVGAGIVMLVSGKTQPTAAKIDPAPNPAPAPTPNPTPNPVPTPVPKKTDPPSIANNFAGHTPDPAAERRTAEWVLANGGELSVAPPSGNARPITLKTDLPAAFAVSRVAFSRNSDLTEADIVAHLTGLSGPLEVSFIDCRRFGDEAVKALARVPKLTALIAITTPDVTDAGLAALAGHPAVVELDVQATGVTRAGIKHITTLPALRKLALAVKDTDAWLPDLAPLVNLERLELLATTSAYLTERGLTHLKPFRKLRHLSLFGLNVKDEWLKLLLDAGPWPVLEELQLRETSIEGPGLVHLKDFPRVDWVSLSRSRVRDEGLAHVAAAARVKWVYLNNTTIGDDGLRALAKNPALRQVELQNNKKITNAGVSALAACRDLEHLDLANTDVGDGGVKALVACKALKRLILTGTPVTAKAVGEVKEALPGCAVVHTDPKAAGAKFDPKLLVGKWERQDIGKNRVLWEFKPDQTLVVTTVGNLPSPARPYALDGDKLTCEGIKVKGTDDAKTVYTVLKLTDGELEVKGPLDRTFQYKKLR